MVLVVSLNLIARATYQTFREKAIYMVLRLETLRLGAPRDKWVDGMGKLSGGSAPFIVYCAHGPEQ